MSFDDRKYYADAKNHDVAAAALASSIALDHIASALESVAGKIGIDLSVEIEKIRSQSGKLDGFFDTLTGYTPDAR